jgi:hypothetical protein
VTNQGPERIGKTVYSEPMIFPLSAEDTIYGLQDESGTIIGTGTREVCELLLHILSNQSTEHAPAKVLARRVRETATPHVNIKSAIAI